MPDDMNEILQRLTRVETKLDIMNSARDIALEAMQSSKSAHLRMDEMRDELSRLKLRQGRISAGWWARSLAAWGCVLPQRDF